MDPQKIGKFILQLRKERNLSQYQLADMIPISRQGVSKWERGVTTPDPQTLIALSELFNVTIDELLRGERSENHSIEKLEETTLSILDQSNKKTKTIKRITTISISIITILLLAFLSYYFINSYNSIEIYKIGNTGNNFTTVNGILITTSDNYYLKLGKIKNKIDANITNIKLYYKKNNKKILIIEDKDVDNITVIDSYGYKENITRNEINKLKDNLYLEITYNDNEKETIKLRYRRDYQNSSLFFLKQKIGEKKESAKEEVKEIAKADIKEEKKTEETKPTIQEEQPKQETQPESPKPQEEKTPELPQPEPTITNEQIANKIKETGTLEDGTYTCGYDNYNIMLMYYEDTNKIEYYENYSLIGTSDIERNINICKINSCETRIMEIVKNYLFA